MNSLLAPRKNVARFQASGALAAFFHAVCDKPNRQDPDRILWRGTMEDIRQGGRLNAEHPETFPDTVEAVVDLLQYSRPMLRRQGFLLAPKRLTAGSTVTVRRKPKGYLPEWERDGIG